MVGILKSQLLRILYVYSVFSTHHLYSAGLVEIDWGGQKCKTTFKKQDYDPVWNEDFPFTFEESTKSKGVEDLVLGVKDWGVTALTGYDHVGEIIIPSKTLNQLVWHSKNETMEQFADLPVIDKNGKQIVGKDGQLCELTFEIKVFVDSETSQADSDLLVINKAKPLTSRSAAPGPKTPPIVTESLNQVEKQMMDQLDDDLQALALSGTLPLEVQVTIALTLRLPHVVGHSFT